MVAIPMLRTILIQIAVCAALIAGAEITARALEPLYNNRTSTVKMDLTPHPYMMWTAAWTPVHSWWNQIAHVSVPTTMQFNNYGFSETFDFTMIPDALYLQTHGKKPGEKIVLFTGGSAASGVGASANNKTISAQMQRYLNERSHGMRYRVINMGMVDWIAYQQFIGLSLFGLSLDPDWIVSMDGVNDATAPCVNGSGAGNPTSWPLMLYMLQGGTGARYQVNAILQSLAHYSALVRMAFGVPDTPQVENPLLRNMEFDKTAVAARSSIRTKGLTVSEQDRQIEFYLQAQRNVIALFNHANVIMSTQPMMNDSDVYPAYRAFFSLKGTVQDLTQLNKALDEYMQENKSNSCSTDLRPKMLGYFMGRSALKLGDLVAEEQSANVGRHIIYMNPERALPIERSARSPFFVDYVHMSDLGQERIGELYAEVILNAENGKSFNYTAFVNSHTLQH